MQARWPEKCVWGVLNRAVVRCVCSAASCRPANNARDKTHGMARACVVSDGNICLIEHNWEARPVSFFLVVTTTGTVIETVVRQNVTLCAVFSGYTLLPPLARLFFWTTQIADLVGKDIAKNMAAMSFVHRKDMYRSGFFRCEGVVDVTETPQEVSWTIFTCFWFCCFRCIDHCYFFACYFIRARTTYVMPPPPRFKEKFDSKPGNDYLASLINADHGQCHMACLREVYSWHVCTVSWCALLRLHCDACFCRTKLSTLPFNRFWLSH